MLLAPLVASLRSAGHRIGIAAGSQNRALYRDDVVCNHDANAPDALQEIVARNYDAALIATEKHAGYRLARDAGIPERIGFFNGLAKPFKSLWVRSVCTRAIFRPAIGGKLHEAQTLYRLVDGFTTEQEPTRAVDRLRDLFTAESLREPRGTLVQLTRKWLTIGSVEKLARLLRELDERIGIRCIGARHERELLDEIERTSGLGVEKFIDTREWIARIAGARALITPDTGAAHVAGMVGTHVVDIFADDSNERLQRRWSPWASTYRVFTMSDLRGADAADRIVAALMHQPTESRTHP